uniref:Uncharacterized protein n=1 Tax=mine drainage metagenome TaxID=410659 RepID=E6PD56_9ZZZZ
MLFFGAIAAAAAPLGATTLPSGQAVYSEALNAMRSQSLPATIDYRVTTVDRGLQLTLQCGIKPPYQYASSSVSMSGGGTHPPQTWNVHFVTSSGFGHAVLASKRAVTVKCTPFPLAPVMHAFVHLAPKAAATHAPAAPAGPFDMMKAIVTVRAFYSRSYRIANDGIVAISGHPSYHLQFTARDGNESKHPVTDMYVDTATHLVRAVVLGGGQRGFFEGGGGFGRFTFGHVGPYWLVKSIHVEGSGHFLFMHGGGAIDMTLHHFSFPSAAAATPAPSPTPSPS